MTHYDRITNHTATYRNSIITDGMDSALVAGFFMTEDGEMEVRIPTGTPSDYVGRAYCEMNQVKKKWETKARLRAKLEAKRMAK